MKYKKGLLGIANDDKTKEIPLFLAFFRYLLVYL